jgi:hypothetical protein
MVLVGALLASYVRNLPLIFFIIYCSYIGSVWMEFERVICIMNVWGGMNVNDCLKGWCENANLNPFKALPLIIERGTWLVRNSSFSENRIIPP